MFLRAKIRRKDGKDHRTFSIVENRRVSGGRVVQRHVLYLGEISDSQELAWRKSIEAFEEGAPRPKTLSLFPEDRCEGIAGDGSVVRLKLKQLRLVRPRTFGACWLALVLWRELQLDTFWNAKLPSSRKGTRWDEVLFVLVTYRLLSPGSEWRLHREWFDKSALGDLLGSEASLSQINTLYRCHDLLLAHKQAVFDHLVGRWREALEQLVRTHSTPQHLAMRARIILQADESVGVRESARELDVAPKTVRYWRKRWRRAADRQSVAWRLADAPRSGAPATFTPEQVCALVVMTCEKPSQSARPISHWSQREIADEAMRRGLVPSISQRSVGRF